MNSTEQIFHDSALKYPWLSKIDNEIQQAAEMIIKCFEKGNKLFLAGNGGSFADSLHIAGELGKTFEKKHIFDPGFEKKIETSWAKALLQKLEPALPVIVLGLNTSLQTALINDTKESLLFFAQELFNLAKPGDLFWGISTSGTSKNIIITAELARILAVTTIGLTGADGKDLKQQVDLCIQAPVKGFPSVVQEYHIVIYHLICRLVEERMF